MPFEWSFRADGAAAILDTWFGNNTARLERAFLKGTAQSAAQFVDQLRADMSGAGLGGLGRAIGTRSDSKRGGIKRRYAGNGFSASAQAYVRSNSERSIGALKSYLRGSSIRPVRSRWLWIPTDDIPRVAKKYRLTPALWAQSGLDQRIGPLVLVKSVNGNPLLVVKNVGLSASGQRRSARSLTKKGMPRKGQIQKEFLVAFIGIPSTARAARVNVDALYASVMQELPQTIANHYGRI